jgi:hypothetical protein
MGDVKTDVHAKTPEIADAGSRDLAAPQETEAEIVDQTDVFDEVIAAANKLEAYAKAQDQILNIIVKRTFAGDWVCHTKESTPEAERTANLGAAGAERIANFLGVQESNWKEYPKEWSEDKKHYSYSYSADFTFRGITRHAIGRAGTRDKFFSGGKAMEDINEDDIRVAAFRETFKKGLTRLFGLRNIPLTKLTTLGYDIKLVKMVDYADKGKQIKRDDLKPGANGLIEKIIMVVNLEKFEGVGKDKKDDKGNIIKGKPWIRFDLTDKEGIKYAVWANTESKRIQVLAERQEDQKPIKIGFKVVAFNGRENYQIEWVEGAEA